MRGDDTHQDRLYSYVSPEQRVPADHPLRAIRCMANTVLERLSPQWDALYSKLGRPSIPPEKLLRALLLQVLYTLRSERLLMEELDYNLLFRWFVGMNLDDPVWDATVYCKNRERLLQGKVAEAFFQEVLKLAAEQHLLSDEHFTVDGTLIEAWASLKSFKKKEAGQTPPPPRDDAGNPTVDFHGEQRSNATHQSTTDPEARLSRKGAGKEAKLNYLGHVLMENRNGLAVQAELTQATGTAERQAAVAMMAAQAPQGGVTLGGDKNYDTQGCVAELRAAGVTPHVAQNTARRGGSAIDGRTTRHPGYDLSQRLRKRVEEIFGWLKTVGGMRKTRFRGTARVGWMFTWALAAYNLVRMRNLLPEVQ
jgi:transposase